MNTRPTCFFVIPFRNIPHQQVQPSSRIHGGCPRQQMCFKTISFSCGAKCNSSFRAHRLVGRMAADRLPSLLRAKPICVSKGKRGGTWHCWPAPLAGGPGRPHVSGRGERTVRSRLRMNGETIAPWNVDVTHEHNDQKEKRGLWEALLQKLFYRHSLALMCVWMYFCLRLRVWIGLFPVRLNPHTLLIRVKHPANLIVRPWGHDRASRPNTTAKSPKYSRGLTPQPFNFTSQKHSSSKILFCSQNILIYFLTVV